MEDVGQPDYLRYWGKTRKSAVEGEPNGHLLAWHCLDVAACGYKMAESNRFGFRDRQAACGIDGQNALNWIGWLFAIHDTGKFARGFQRFASFPDSPLVPPVTGIHALCRHDSLGMYLWRKLFDDWTNGDNQLIAGVEVGIRDEYELALANIPQPSLLNPYSGHQALFPFIDTLTPLQQRACELDITPPGPQLVIMEDVSVPRASETACFALPGGK